MIKMSRSLIFSVILVGPLYSMITSLINTIIHFLTCLWLVLWMMQ